MKKRNLILAVLALVLAVTVSVPSALAYFTTYVRAAGTKPVHLAEETRLKEPKPVDWTKHLTVTAQDGSEPVFVRARAFAPDGLTLTYSGENWTQNGDFWYYGPSIKGGESAAELLIKIDNIPQDVKEDENFNVVVVYECTPVLYDAQGNETADWNGKVTTTTENGGGN